MRWPCLSNQSLERLLQTCLFHRCNWNQRKYAFTYKIRSPPLEKHKFLVIVRIVRFAAPKDLFYSCLGRSEVGHGRMFAKTAHLTSFGLPKAQLSANNVQFTIFSKLSISLCVTRGAPDEVEKWHTELCCCPFRTLPTELSSTEGSSTWKMNKKQPVDESFFQCYSSIYLVILSMDIQFCAVTGDPNV